MLGCCTSAPRFLLQLKEQAHGLERRDGVEVDAAQLLGNFIPGRVAERHLRRVLRRAGGRRQLRRAGSAYETFGDYGVKVAAKTGTAQLGDNQVNNAIFICYAPYDNPKVAVAVVVEHGSAGASIASIARDFLDAYFTVKTVDTAPESELSLLR